MIWWFYACLKEYKQVPGPQQAEILRARFDRIFKRRGTGYVMLDRLLKRLFRRKDALLRVLDRPEIPLNTNASENDIRTFVTKRKISGGTVSDSGRNARGIMLGLAKTCMRLKLSALITLLWMIHHSYDREFPGQGHRSGLQRRKPEGFSGQFGKDDALEIAIP